MLKSIASAFGVGLSLAAVTSNAWADEASDWSAQLSLVEEYRLRIASNVLPSPGPIGNAQVGPRETDQHLRFVGDGELIGADERFLALASGALWYDLDGRAPSEAQAQFATQYDNANPYVAAYALSAEWRKHGVLDHARLGRQSSEHGMPTTFDGASLGLRLLNRQLLLFGFGGRTVHFFEAKPGLLENSLGSVGLTYRPMEALALELDGRVTQEQVLNEERTARDQVTTPAVGLSGSWRSELIYTKLYGRGVDNQFSHLGGAFQFQHPRLGLGLDARIQAQLVTLNEVVESENPFFSLLGPSLPNARFRFEAWKDLPVGEKANLGLHLGWRQRQVIGHQEQTFNRNTGAIYVQARVDDFIQRGLFLGGTAEWNYVPASLQDEWILAYGGSTGFAGQAVKTELGTYFQQYKINYYRQAEELHNTRTVYGSVSYRVMDALEFRGRYEMDIFDRYLQSFYLSARQDF